MWTPNRGRKGVRYMARKGKSDDRDLFLRAAAEALVAAKERGYSAAFLSSAVARARRLGWQGSYEDALRILQEVAVPHVGRWVTFHEKGATCPMCDAARFGREDKGRPGADPKTVFGL